MSALSPVAGTWQKDSDALSAIHTSSAAAGTALRRCQPPPVPCAGPGCRRSPWASPCYLMAMSSGSWTGEE